MSSKRRNFTMTCWIAPIAVLMSLHATGVASAQDLRKHVGQYSVVKGSAAKITLTSAAGTTGKLSWQKGTAKPVHGAVLPLGRMLVAGLTESDRQPGVVVYKIDKDKGTLQGVGALLSGRFYEACQVVPGKKGEYRIVKAKNTLGEAYTGSLLLKKLGSTYQVTHRRNTKAGVQEWKSVGIVREGNLICGWGSLAVYEPSVDNPGFLLGKIWKGDKVEEHVLRKVKVQPVAVAPAKPANPPKVGVPNVKNPNPAPAVAAKAPAVNGPIGKGPVPANVKAPVAQPAMVKPVAINAGIPQLGQNFLWQAHINVGLVADGFANKAFPAPVARLQLNVIRGNVRRVRNQFRGLVAAAGGRKGGRRGVQNSKLRVHLVSFAQGNGADSQGMASTLSACDMVEQECDALDALLADPTQKNGQAFDAIRKQSTQQLEKTFGSLSSAIAAKSGTGKATGAQAAGTKSAQVGSRRPGARSVAKPIQLSRSPANFSMVFAQQGMSSGVPSAGSEKQCLGTLLKCLTSELDSSLGLIADCRQAGFLDDQTARDLCLSCNAMSSDCARCCNGLCASGALSDSDAAFSHDFASYCRSCGQCSDSLGKYCASGDAKALASFESQRAQCESQADRLCGVSKAVAALNQNTDGLSVDDAESRSSQREAALSSMLEAASNSASQSTGDEASDASSSESLFGSDYLSQESSEDDALSLSAEEASFFEEAKESFAEASDASDSEMEFEETELSFNEEEMNLSEVAKESEEMPAETLSESEGTPSETEGTPSPSEGNFSEPEGSPSTPEGTPSETEPSPSVPEPEASSPEDPAEPKPKSPTPEPEAPASEEGASTPEKEPSPSEEQPASTPEPAPEQPQESQPEASASEDSI